MDKYEFVKDKKFKEYLTLEQLIKKDYRLLNRDMSWDEYDKMKKDINHSETIELYWKNKENYDRKVTNPKEFCEYVEKILHVDPEYMTEYDTSGKRCITHYKRCTIQFEYPDIASLLYSRIAWNRHNYPDIEDIRFISVYKYNETDTYTMNFYPIEKIYDNKWITIRKYPLSKPKPKMIIKKKGEYRFFKYIVNVRI